MKSLLDIYTYLKVKADERFVAETFVDEVYKEAKPKLTVVDIGAYAGDFSFYCLPFAKKIYAIEPDPVPFKTLIERVDIFEANDVILTFNFAIGPKNGSRRMSLSHNGGSRWSDNHTGEMVESKTLATFMRDQSIEYIDILKIDIEGSEAEVFSAPSFANLVPKINLIIGEHEGFNLLKNYGYKVERLDMGTQIARK